MSVPTPLCSFCGKAIGVYEPLIALGGDDVLETSRAAARNGQLRGALYHRDCWLLCTRMTDQPPADSRSDEHERGTPSGRQ